jgi:hypothetical protein
MDALAIGTVWRLPSKRIARVVSHSWKALAVVLQYEGSGEEVTLRREFLAKYGVAV